MVGWPEDAREIISASNIYCEPDTFTPHLIASAQAQALGIPIVLPDSALHKNRFGSKARYFAHGKRHELARAIYKLLNQESLQIRDCHEQMQRMAS